MNRTLVRALAILAAFALLMVGSIFVGITFGRSTNGLIATATAEPRTDTRPIITEDSPEWNGATMGDRETGPNYVPPSVPANCFGARLPWGNVLWLEQGEDGTGFHLCAYLVNP